MSEKLARSLFADVQQFNSELVTTGWASTTTSATDTKSAVDLFETEERPLVVGLFGGTGVGKSSLLNRLAGAEIARSGVARPTSMEITAYLHESVQLDALPDHFDAASFSANRHSNAALAEVMWVDMPDFDSNETANKEQVLQWLPHIDLLLYVVTPERYKDAEGWRMMLDNSYHHGWLFVFNQWDRADPVQYNDLVRLLEGNGFSSPQVFRTVCVGQHDDDQFAEMVDVITSLSNHKIVQQLQEHGWMQRLERANLRLEDHRRTLAEFGAVGLSESFATRWRDFEQSAAAHLDAPFKQHSELFADKKTDAIGTVMKSLSGTRSSKDIAANIATRASTDTLWDNWLTTRLTDSIQQFRFADTEHGVPASVFAIVDKTEGNSIGVNSVADQTNADPEPLMTPHFKQSIDAAIKSPGTATQRFVARCASVLKLALPILALVWVALRVVNGFISGTEDRSAYVGLDFLVNGLMLAGLGWLIPFVVEKIFVPSLPDSVYRALHQGLNSGLLEMRQQLQPALAKIQDQRKSHEAHCSDLQQRIDKLLSTALQSPDPLIGKVIKLDTENR